MQKGYPKEILELPEIDVPFTGVRGHLLQGDSCQLVFFDIDPIGEIAPHTHGAQWGIVVEGSMELTIGGKAERYQKGDSYYIPAGVEHSARFLTRTKIIDFFAEPQRYQAKG